MYKIIALDLDGTSLNSFGQMTVNTKCVLQKAMEKGTELIIASGRNINSIKPIAEDLKKVKYIIAGNGAIIYDLENTQILCEKNIPKNKALEIIKICKQNSIYFSVYTNRTIITENLKYNVLCYHKENARKEDYQKTHITLVDDIAQYVKNMEEEVIKIFICDETESIFKSILKKFSETRDIDILDVSHMTQKIIKQGTSEIKIEYYYTEISAENVDKWVGIEFLLDRLGINKEEVIAIGDNMNDKQMIENAGFGIAMGNSSPCVKEISDFVTDTNDNEGVAKAIEKFVIN